jgi:hypothetical protein
MCITWLQAQGLLVVDRTFASQQTSSHDGGATPSGEPLSCARAVNASQLVLVETPITDSASAYSTWSGTALPFSASSSAAGGSDVVYSTSVCVRGVDPATGRVLWSGSARYGGRLSDLDDSLAKLTCQALATAWGFRRSGQRAISSVDMCDSTRENEPRESDGSED